MARPSDKQDKKRKKGSVTRFPERASKEWQGPLVMYREVELLRKFMTSSSKLMSRKRASTNSQEQAAVRNAVHQARFMALLPYAGT